MTRTTRRRVMKEAVVPKFMAFCDTRAWMEMDLKQVDLVERNALRACWQPIDQEIKRETLKWVGHIARMGRDRLPKIAIFG